MSQPKSNEREERPPKIIFLTRGQFTLVDEEDYEYLSQFNWHANTASSGYFRKYYVTRTDNVNGTKIKMCRDLMKPGDGMLVDHINGNPLDNRRSNLRVCTKIENSMNRLANFKNKYGRKGVTMKHGVFATSITVNGKAIYLGSYKTADEAGDAYEEAAKKYHGEFYNAEPTEVFYNQDELDAEVADAYKQGYKDGVGQPSPTSMEALTPKE